MTPELDRRQRSPHNAGWHTLDALVRQALEMQRDIGTDSAVAFLQSTGICEEVISRVLAPDARIRAADQAALGAEVVVADLPISPRRIFRRNN